VFTSWAGLVIVRTWTAIQQPPKEPKLKDKNINIRVSPEQHAKIMKEARKLGMTVSAYILMLAGAK